MDLAALLARADAAALHEARGALALVAGRGFHRGRQLVTALEATVREFQA